MVEAAALLSFNSPQWKQFTQNPTIERKIEKIRQVHVSRLPQSEYKSPAKQRLVDDIKNVKEMRLISLI